MQYIYLLSISGLYNGFLGLQLSLGGGELLDLILEGLDFCGVDTVVLLYTIIQ